MSDRFVQSPNDTHQSNMQSYQSVWMAHWMRTSCDEAQHTRDDPIVTKTFEIVNKSLKISSKSTGMQNPLFKCTQDTNDTQALRPVFHNGKVVDGEGTSKNPIKWTKLDSNAKRGIFATPKPLQEFHVESSSHILPYGFEFGKEEAAIVFKQLQNANMNTIEHDNDSYSLHELQNCVHDVETMTSYRSTKVATETNGNASNDRHGLPPFPGQSKRLKLNTSISTVRGTKISDPSENLSHEKTSKFFSCRTLKSEITSEEPMQEDAKKKGNELLLSHAWIQRWLSNRSRITEKTKAETVEVSNLWKEQFPSIAAMALMGRAITGFQPCELQKRGSFTVWKTKAF